MVCALLRCRFVRTLSKGPSDVAWLELEASVLLPVLN